MGSKLDGHSRAVYSICYSPDGTTLASGGQDKSIRLWDVKSGQEILYPDNRFKDILAQFQVSGLRNINLQEGCIYFSLLSVISPVNFLVISKQLRFCTQGALILKGQFSNQSGIDLRKLFKQKGSFILENQFELQKQ
ncbi:unnamed protein product [Paramecium octaurelia]|uniref:Uncharacterized protein n=1 Tax=Paramecium octaurelia TaxID=43137 RepID=A0A8S1YS03_PAROT|nr:unnamed protein product [Paramecium octaurelia]